MDTCVFNKPLNELMVYLLKRDVIENMKNFLNQNGLEIHVRKFLSFFMIYYHSNEILDDSDFSIELNKQVKRCIKVYDSLRNEYKEYKLNIFHYVVNETEKWFDIWKKQDKYKLIMPMIYMYHHLEHNKTNRDDWNNEITKQQEMIKEKILKLDSNAINMLNNPPRVEINPEARENVVNVVYKAYWDRFQESIKEKEWEQLINFMKEVKTMLKEIVPNRTDIHQEIEDKIDVDILKQRLENDAMSLDDIYIIMEYIVKMIKQFQAPADDNDTEEWWNHIKELETWDVMMRDFFMVCFAKLDKIKIILNKIKNEN